MDELPPEIAGNPRLRAVYEAFVRDLQATFDDGPVLGDPAARVRPGDTLPMGTIIGVEDDHLVIDLETPVQAAERITRDASA